MKILLTGATGYTGRALAEVIATRHDVRGLDVRGGDRSPADMIIGDITDPAVCEQAVKDCEALVMCHMAPNPDGYKTPPAGIDINVKGTANLYHAAVDAGIRRVVLISTTGVLANPRQLLVPGTGPYNATSKFYALTKIMQEYVARFYYENHGISTIALRPSWIVYDESLVTKYGERMTTYNGGLIDPRDIGNAVILALELDDPGIDGFVVAQDDSGYNLSNTHEVLKWRPQYTFKALPRREKA